MLKIEGKERKEGLVPAVVYGPEIDNETFSIDAVGFRKVLREAGESSIISLMIEDKEYKVLVKDYQLDPVTDKFIHVDFYQPILTEAVEASVPVVIKGEAPAVKEEGGVLVRNINEVTVSALPESLPSEIEIDVSSLEDLNDTVTIGELDLSDDVEIQREDSDVVVSVSSPKTAEELEEEMGVDEEDDLFVGEEVELEEEMPEEEEEEEGIEI